jgi:hypothetical protein
MPDKRPKAQQEPQSSSSKEGKKNSIVVYALVLILLLAAAFYAGRHYRNHKYDSFAQCLASKQAKMYGLYWCPHCADQKRMFGDSFHYVPYVECAIRGSHELATECKVAGVKLFPSWQFGTDPPKEGVLSLQELSEKAGCKLP